MLSIAEILDGPVLETEKRKKPTIAELLDGPDAQPLTPDELSTYRDSYISPYIARPEVVSDGVHSDAWNARQSAMRSDALAAGLPDTQDSRKRVMDAISRSEKAGFISPHFMGLADEPTGDRGPTRDIENLVSALKAQELTTPIGKERDAIAAQRAYWEKEVRDGGMSAQQWKEATGENDPQYPHERSLQAAGAYGASVDGPRNDRPMFDDPDWTPTDRAIAETIGKGLDYGKSAINEFAPGFLEQATTSPLPATHYQPDENDTKLEALGKAGLNTFTGTMEGLTSPAMLSALPLGNGFPTLGRVMAAGFGLDMASHVPGHIKQAVTDPTFQGQAEGALGAVAELMMAHAAMKHAASEPKVVEPVRTTQESVSAAPIPEPPTEPVRPTEENAPTFVVRDNPEVASLLPERRAPDIESTDPSLSSASTPSVNDAAPLQEPVRTDPQVESVLKEAALKEAQSEPGKIPAQKESESEPATAGIARRFVEEDVANGVLPPESLVSGEGWTAQAALDRGRNLINGGVDPGLVTEALKGNRRFPPGVRDAGDAVAVLHAERERLAAERQAAQQAAIANPSNPALAGIARNAERAEIHFLQTAKPQAGGLAQRIMVAFQEAHPVDLSTFEGLYRKAIDVSDGRELAPGQKAELVRRANKAKFAKSAEAKAMDNLQGEIDRTLPRRNVPTEQELAAEVEKMVNELTPCQ